MTVPGTRSRWWWLEARTWKTELVLSNLPRISFHKPIQYISFQILISGCRKILNRLRLRTHFEDIKFIWFSQLNKILQVLRISYQHGFKRTSNSILLMVMVIFSGWLPPVSSMPSANQGDYGNGLKVPQLIAIDNTRHHATTISQVKSQRYICDHEASSDWQFTMELTMRYNLVSHYNLL